MIPVGKYEVVVDVSPGIVASNNPIANRKREILAELFQINVPANSFHINDITIYRDGAPLPPNQQKIFWHKLNHDPRSLPPERVLERMGGYVAKPSSNQDELINRLFQVSSIIQKQSYSGEISSSADTHQLNAFPSHIGSHNHKKNFDKALKITRFNVKHFKFTCSRGVAGNVIRYTLPELKTSSKTKGIDFRSLQSIHTEQSLKASNLLSKLDKRLGSVARWSYGIDSYQHYSSQRMSRDLATNVMDGLTAFGDTKARHYATDFCLKPLISKTLKYVAIYATGAEFPLIAVELSSFVGGIIFTSEVWPIIRSKTIDRVFLPPDIAESLAKANQQLQAYCDNTTFALHFRNTSPLEGQPPVDISQPLPTNVFTQLRDQHQAAILQSLNKSLFGRIQIIEIGNINPPPTSTAGQNKLNLFTGPFRNPTESMELSQNYYARQLFYSPPMPPSHDTKFWFKGREFGFNFPLGNINGKFSVDIAVPIAFLRWGISLIKEHRLPPPAKAVLAVYRQGQKYIDARNHKNEIKFRNLIDKCSRLNSGDSRIIHFLDLVDYSLATKKFDGLEGLIKSNEYAIESLQQSYHEDLSRQQQNPEPWKAFPRNLQALNSKAVHDLNQNNPQECLRTTAKLEDALQLQSAWLDPATRSAYLDNIESFKYGALLLKAQQTRSPADISALEQHQQSRIAKSPKDLLLQREMVGAYHQLDKIENAIQCCEHICESPQANESDFLQRASLQEKAGKLNDAFVSYKILLERVSDKNSDLAYFARDKICDHLIRANSPEEAIPAFQEMCTHKHPLDKSFEAARYSDKFNHTEQAAQFYIKYLAGSEALQVHAPDRQYEAANYVGTHFKEKEPGLALGFFKQCLVAKPGDTEAIKNCEDICLNPYRKSDKKDLVLNKRHFNELKSIYESQEKHNEYAAQKKQQLIDYFNNKDFCDHLEGSAALAQIICGIAAKNLSPGTTRKLVYTVDAGLSLTLRTVVPYLRSTKHIDTITTKSINKTNLVALGALTLFHLGQELEIIDPNHNLVRKVLNPGVEGLTFLYDSYQTTMFFTSCYQSWGDIGAMANTTKEFISLVTHKATCGANCVVVLENIEVQLEALQGCADLIASGAGAISLGMRGYEMVCRASGSALPENQAYYVVRNTLGYGGATIFVVGKLGLTPVIVSSISTGVGALGTGAAWVGSSIAAGGTQAVIGVVGGATGVGLVIAGGYVVYKGCEYLHGWTTGQDQLNAMRNNANLLAKSGKLDEAIAKLDECQVIKKDHSTSQWQNSLLCNKYLSEDNKDQLNKVITISNRELTQPEAPLTPEMRLTFLQLRFSAASRFDNEVESLKIYRQNVVHDIMPHLQDEKEKESYREALGNMYFRTAVEQYKAGNISTAEKLISEAQGIDTRPVIKQQWDLFCCDEILKNKNSSSKERNEIVVTVNQQFNQPDNPMDIPTRRGFLALRLFAASGLINNDTSLRNLNNDTLELIRETKDPKEQESFRQAMGEAYFRRAAEEYQQGNLTKAEEITSNACKIDSRPENKERLDLIHCEALLKKENCTQQERNEVVNAANHQLTQTEHSLDPDIKQSYLALKLFAASGLTNDKVSLETYNDNTLELIKGSKDEKQQEHYRQTMAGMWLKLAAHESQGNLAGAVALAKKAHEIDPRAANQQQVDLLECFRLAEEKEYVAANQISSRWLNEEKDKPTSQMRSSLLSARLHVAYLDENANPDIAWQDYQEMEHIDKTLADNIEPPVKPTTDAIEKQKALAKTVLKQKISQILLRSTQKEKVSHETKLKYLDEYLVVNPNDAEIREYKRIIGYQLDFESNKDGFLIDKCTHKLNQNQNDIQALRFSALIYMKQQNHELAQHYFNRLLKIDPDDVQSKICLSKIACGLQDFRSAEQHAKDAEQSAKKYYQHELEESKKADSTETAALNNKKLKIASQQVSDAEYQSKLVQDEITSIWTATAGQTAGKIAVEVAVHLIRGGAEILKSVTRTHTEENQILPFIRKAGIYSRNSYQHTTHDYRAMRYLKTTMKEDSKNVSQSHNSNSKYS